jgi:hypothetical protein
MSLGALTPSFNNIGQSSTVIGYNAQNNMQTGCVVIGYDATSPTISNNTVIIGNGANATGSGDNVIAIGYAATGQAALYGVCIGAKATVGPNSIAIGGNASGIPQNVVAIGDGAKALAQGAVTIGQNSSSNGTNSIVIGLSSIDVSKNNCIVLDTTGGAAFPASDGQLVLGGIVTDSTPRSVTVEYLPVILGNPGTQYWIQLWT